MSVDWAALAAPDLAEFERLAEQAYARLPEAFRALSKGVVLRIDDFPTEDVLRELDAETEFDLLGLFTGVGLAQGEEMSRTGQMPNVVHLYRRPILDYWAEHDETLGAIVTHVLIHEIGHHFGLSDEDMEAIEAGAEAAEA
ncbi:metallopeptidase family protein [Methylopila henanensis]|uniref:Metallopeptidase family protein n=1 Tax=Methylopila henanensis TaxID=873516 RepID=A0ABW4KAW9_9HYPH